MRRLTHTSKRLGYVHICQVRRAWGALPLAQTQSCSSPGALPYCSFAHAEVYAFGVFGALIVGSISGVAIALGQSSGITSALSGVTLSASLLPPVVNCGLMLVFAVVYPELRTEDGYTLVKVGLTSLGLYACNVARRATLPPPPAQRSQQQRQHPATRADAPAAPPPRAASSSSPSPPSR